MRIGFIHDQRFTQRPGGATRLAERLYAAAPVETIWLTADTDFDPDCDGYVALHTKFPPESTMRQLLDRPFVRYELDYWTDDEPNAKYRDALNEAARRVLFVSPLHQDIYQHRHHIDLSHKSDVVACAIDPEEFRPTREKWVEWERENAIWFGEWAWAKGPDIAMKWALEQQTVTDFYSPIMPPNQKAPNAYTRLHGRHEEEGWWDTIASHQQFVHLPRQPECFSMAPLEAALLGLETIVAGRQGWESFGLDMDGIIDLCSHGAERFWSLTLDALGG